MKLDQYHDVIHACRFCFMCRHLASTGNVTFRESDTPRGRALIADKISRNPKLMDNPDYVQAFYDAGLSAACRYHCVSHFDEAGLILAARQDIVDAGHAPQKVRDLADELAQGDVVLSGPEPADVLYFTDQDARDMQPQIARAMTKIMKAAKIRFRTISGPDCGKALKVLGYPDRARDVAKKYAAVIKNSGAKILVTSSPAAYDAFKNDYPYFELSLGSDIEIVHSADYITRMVKNSQLPILKMPAGKIMMLASDFLKNYNNADPLPLLANTLGLKTASFGCNIEESYTAGEGAVVLDRLHSALVQKLVAKIVTQIESPDQEILLVASPYTRHILQKFAGKNIIIRTVEELVAESIQE